jgi:hypothetical protein
VTFSVSRGVWWASGLAVALHGLLFFAARPGLNGGRVGGIPVSPRTYYLAPVPAQLPMARTEMRILGSPVLFALPSSLGFSRALMQQDVSTRLDTLSRPQQSEQFLAIDPAAGDATRQLVTPGLMVSSMSGGIPALPNGIYPAAVNRPSARRVTIVPALRERLIGGIVLPPALNQEVPQGWEVSATMSVSGLGTVEHVFLNRPLEPPALNQQVLQLLYGLRFKPGEPVDGSIEIYSPETTSTTGGAP